ncbi:hypothetical protein [Streptomyces sp. NPDC005955]|uniref:hypothetical protein n=1 Tax=Streptomyces sp. NPDC005955 TaxID=3364738 RepID=UPI003698D71B
MLVSARSFDEYRAMFTLTEHDLTLRILDCPGGAAGFVAEAGRLGVDARAVDPAYAHDRRRLGELALREVQYKHTALVAEASKYVWTWFGDPERYTTIRTGAARAFLADVTARPDRYTAGSLPRLPFQQDAFDLVLSSHLLFSYGARLDEAFHLGALLDLARVARWEVRLFPVLLHTSDLRYGALDRLRGELADRGVPSRLERVAYAFQPGGDEMLVLSCTDYRPPPGPTSSAEELVVGAADPVRWRHRETPPAEGPRHLRGATGNGSAPSAEGLPERLLEGGPHDVPHGLPAQAALLDRTR